MRKGFALVELLIAIGLFLGVVTIGVGGFVRALRSIRQNAALVSASGNASLALEQMAREMRTGYDFCTNGQLCALPNEISFKNAKGDTVSYQASEGIVERECAGTCDDEPGVASMTPASVSIKGLDFTVFGNEPDDTYQPRVTIRLSVGTKEIGTQGAITNLQTTVSSRLPLDS
jgi:type II secretory pathway pseudopilin PulG